MAESPCGVCKLANSCQFMAVNVTTKSSMPSRAVGEIRFEGELEVSDVDAIWLNARLFAMAKLIANQKGIVAAATDCNVSEPASSPTMESDCQSSSINHHRPSAARVINACRNRVGCSSLRFNAARQTLPMIRQVPLKDNVTTNNFRNDKFATS